LLVILKLLAGCSGAAFSACTRVDEDKAKDENHDKNERLSNCFHFCFLCFFFLGRFDTDFSLSILKSLNLPDLCRLRSEVFEAPWRVSEQILLPVDISGRSLEALILEEF